MPWSLGWALWRSPFSSSFPFVEKIGAGLGTIVTHKPVNKAVSMEGKGCMGVVMLILEILPITLASWEIANLWRSCSSQVVGDYCYYYSCSRKCKKSGNNKVGLFCSTVSCTELKVFLLLFLTFDGSIRTCPVLWLYTLPSASTPFFPLNPF